LLGVHAVVMLALGVTVWRNIDHNAVDIPPIEKRLLALDIPKAEAAVDYALDKAENKTAFTKSDVVGVTSFLALSAQGSGLRVDNISIETLAAPHGSVGVDVVEAVIDLSGDLYDLPIFVDGVHRQRALGSLQSLAFDVKSGGAARGQVRIRYHRPVMPDTSWIGARLSLAAPGAATATPVLEKASTLASWKRFNASDAGRVEHAMSARARAARELPPNLVTLRQTGGRFVWDADAGIAIR
jgi:hypothetical protein